MVTPCGHLLCWPCLLQWLHAQSPFSGPVCKVEVLMEANVTPLYGRGGEEGDSPTNNDLPPARPEATNGGHKKAVDTKLGCSERPPNPSSACYAVSPPSPSNTGAGSSNSACYTAFIRTKCCSFLVTNFHPYFLDINIICFPKLKLQ